MAICAGAAVHETTELGETIHVFGDLDETNAAELERVLDAALALGRAITVDLTRCRYVGSLGLRILLRARRTAHGAFATLVQAGSIAARLLQIANVEERLAVRHVSSTHSVMIAARDNGENVTIVTLDGEWDLSRGSQLRRRIERTLAQPRVILDLSKVTYIDSHCIGMLVRMRTQRVARGYEPARLVIPAGNVRRVLGLLGAQTLWSIHDSLEEALGDWKKPGNIPVADPT